MKSLDALKKEKIENIFYYEYYIFITSSLILNMKIHLINLLKNKIKIFFYYASGSELSSSKLLLVMGVCVIVVHKPNFSFFLYPILAVVFAI